MKRAFDIFCSIYGLVVAGPFLLIVALLIRLESPGPAIFKQKRPTLNNEIFDIYKFRSMKIDTPNVATDLMDPADYITKTGKFIRKTSIDELPQLLNVLKGDMSIVGPRPALYNQYELIEKRTKANVHTIRPGVTGLAQVMGRDNNTDDQKVMYDKYYLENRSFKLDMYIIYKTVINTISSEGVSH
ncbi:sugar transferase [Staphylococcus caledonicus]|uniref:sugar transferase n=1 Tax=Staphylococcus caledonicus TaxID=2741333 RepID=UPI0018E3FA66|nr:sugar transferase [Staphylococcus caledonicus]MBI5973002.1 sugar transferase [Staphylococcus caledonicus]